MLVGKQQVECIRKLTNSMYELKDRIERRNKDLEIPYDVLSPDEIPLTTQV